MPDNTFNALNASGALLEACTSLRRSIMGGGVDSAEAMLLLSDLTVAFDTIESTVIDLEGIANSQHNSWALPKVKVLQAIQDLNELKSGLRLAQSASFAASRALSPEMDRGTSQVMRGAEIDQTAATTPAQQQRGKTTTAAK